MNRNKICPCCNQGNLYLHSRKQLEKEVVVCDECYTMWLDKDNIVYDGGEYGKDFFTFDVFMENLGLPVVSPDWENNQPIYEE